MEFEIRATYNVKFDRIIADLQTAHAVMHYIQMYGNENASHFANQHHIVPGQRQGELGDVYRMCVRLEEGSNYALATVDYQRIWGDCCRFLTRFTLQRLTREQALRFCRAVRGFFFRSMQHCYPNGLAVWRTCHQDMLDDFCCGPANNGRIPMLATRTVHATTLEDGFHVKKFISKVSWSRDNDLGRGVRDFISLPTMRFDHESVSYHAKH